MPSYHHDRGYELADRIERSLRHSHRPPRYIINDGNLIVDERALDYLDRHSSDHHNRPATLIYNSPNSTMWIQSGRSSHGSSSSSRSVCRGCYRRRERYHGSGYCSDCASLRSDTPRRHEIIDFSDRRRLLDYPDRRAIGWR
ncbi:hypothetical protein F4678DRAFT_403485 [Xylaria arbuscula]|nr:hypothetical protein F4678DRAFT_403485 [Xylaria arbuscula]